MGLRSIAGFAAILVLGLVQPAQAQTGTPTGAQTGTQLALVTGDDYPPFADSRLPGGGLATILVQRVIRGMDATATLEFQPWRRGYEETLRGRFDATFPYVRTAERERDFLYSEPLIRLRQVVFMSTERPFAYRSPQDLQGRRVCVALGYAPPAELQVMIEQQQVERVTPGSVASCPNMIVADRADFFVQDERIGSALVAKVGLSATIRPLSDPPFGVTEIHLIVPRQRPDATGLIGRFNDALQRLRASDDYERLLLQ
jgi:polar amino acid transport system substrate-binding protein